MRKLKQYSEFGYHAGMALLFLSLVVDRFWGGIQCQIN
ncbi:hypothetical protein JCM19237_270 [Photobacterium aphoticum]|uniref:Uncharacterized protein n=1 Tax=Photobacterium aphoticum TaxID=754436 RepID=A0A090QXF5_9GAMM|nr:hypothetical protein JCM19237_270 [Photobacterium aphoticum]